MCWKETYLAAVNVLELLLRISQKNDNICIDTLCYVRKYSETPEQWWAVKKLMAMGTYKKQRYRYQHAYFCSATMFISELTTEILENQFSGSGNGCSKFVSIRSWWNMKLPMKMLWKSNLRPRSPFLKGQEGNASVIPPLSGVPEYIYVLRSHVPFYCTWTPVNQKRQTSVFSAITSKRPVFSLQIQVNKPH